MCTLILALGTQQRWPLILATNRDERLDRPSEGWQEQRTLNGHRMLAPRDVVAGGTWVGLNEHGVVAALTNHQTGRPSDPALRSRGELIGLSLDFRSAREAFRTLPRLPINAFNPFHLVIADREFAFLIHTDGMEDDLVVLKPGLHVVTETSALGEGHRGDWIRAHWPSSAEPADVHTLLAHHALLGKLGTCIHLGGIYGTRSSSFLRMGGSLAESTLHTVDTSPCTAPYEDRTHLLRGLWPG